MAIYSPFGRIPKLRLWFLEHVHPSETQTTLFWAGVAGVAGALVSLAFREGINGLLFLMTHRRETDIVAVFSQFAWWQRLLVPVVGGMLAGATLSLMKRFGESRYTSDYMEAIVVGEGGVSTRSSLIKSLSALFSMASGGSLGREGPLVQLSAMTASVIGKWGRWSATRRRLMVACGAAAGIASAYNAPITGALFVSEIIIGSIAMETFGPLVFASVAATLVERMFHGGGALYGIPAFAIASPWAIAFCAVLGLTAGTLSPFFLRFLRWCESSFSKLSMPVFARLGLGGLGVGILALAYPEVCGNGYSVILSVLQGKWVWHGLAMLLLLKVLATGLTLGSGGVGGVFTPTLFVGACLGALFGQATAVLWPKAHPEAFALVGMGAFLAATTHAPIMSILIVFELTLDYQVILPLMLGCLSAYYASKRFQKDSIYTAALNRKGAKMYEQKLLSLRLADLVQPDPPTVRDDATFGDIAQAFIGSRLNNLYVVDGENRYVGVISLHDIKAYLKEEELSRLVIARDIVRTAFPAVTPESPMPSLLEQFSRHRCERLPVINDTERRRIIGSVSKTDVILALAERTKLARNVKESVDS